MTTAPSVTQLLENRTFLAIAVVLLTIAFFLTTSRDTPEKERAADMSQSNSIAGLANAAEGQGIEKAASAMSKPAAHLDPPKDDPIKPSELAKHTGADEATSSIWVAIKGTVFDVSAKREMYGPGGSYHIFAGKDGSVGLGKSSLKPEDARPDFESLEPAERKVLDQWFDFFQKRYNIVGKVVKD